MKVIQKLTVLTVLLTYLIQYVKAQCRPGFYGDGSSCTLCPYDHYCTGNSTQPFQCPPGFTSYDGESECRKISHDEYEYRLQRKLFSCSNMPGYYCVSGSTITECSSGYYCAGAGSQTQCPTGYSWLLSTGIVLCSSGYYSNAGDDYCHICPRGQYCAPPAAPVTCSSGWYSVEGSSFCNQCPAGSKCASTSQLPSICGAGTYQPSVGQTTCASCPVGYSCTTTTATICSAGSYSLVGWDYCRPCPEGYSCSSGVLGSACSAGQYSAEGTDACSTCSAGFYCPYKDGPHKCMEGYYSAAGASTCTLCEVGYYCTAGVRYQCPYLYYADDLGLSACKRAPVHHIVNAEIGASSVTRCTENEYTDARQVACYTCDDAHQCKKDDTVEACPNGYAKLSGQWYCRPCPPGNICVISATAGATVATTITAYETALSTPEKNYPRYSRVAELRASICPPNNYCSDDGMDYHICPHGTFPYITGCLDCSDGFFCMTSFNRQTAVTTGSVSSAGDSFPRFQPQGYTWNSGWSGTQDYTSTLTAKGRVNNAAAALAYTCPTGYSCTNSIHARCPSSHLGQNLGGIVGMIKENQDILHNYENFEGITYTKMPTGTVDTNSQCLPCNGGYSCTLGSAPSACSAGFYSPTASPECFVCPPGHYCASATEFPTACAINTYYANVGATVSGNCASCPTGFYAPTGSSYCNPCPGGYECSTGTPIICETGQYSVEGAISCSACQEGYICDKGATIATPPENLCPKGSYCLTSGSYTLQYKCPQGKYGMAAGAIDSSWCQNCPPGYLCREGTDDFTKYPCPKGYYCAAAAVQETACPAGKYNPNTGAMSADACLTCPAGYYCGLAAVTPTICPSGHWCPLGTTTATANPCPMGTYTGVRTGIKMKSDCLPCPAGSYCGQASISPTPAPIGYYIPYMGATDLKAALQCPAGYPCTTTGNYKYTGSTCAKSYYCPPGSTSSTENPCPAGTYSDKEGLWDESQCTVCPAGSYCLAASTSDDITICPLGHYCPSGTQSATHYPCPTGTVGDVTGLKADYECANCTAGGGCGSGSATVTPCAVGYYCPAGTTTSTPIDYRAPAGSFINFTGATTEYDNYPCGYGKYCPIGSTGATDCPAGTYSNILRAEVCYTCTAGYKWENVGTINPTACGIGYYSDEGATTCTLCPEGHYCYQTVTTMATMEAQVCPAGTICSRDVSGTNYGLNVSPNLVTHKCPVGKYCEGGAAVSNCPAGTYNSITGRKSLDDCLQTPAGFYTLAGASVYLTTPCDAGYYCLAGSATSNPNACPAGTFRITTAARKPEDCAMCKSGYKCPTAATVTPQDCGAGNYCPLGTIIPALCPVGTYSNALNLPDSRSCTKCPTGYYCGSKGMTAVTSADYCDAGFYCIEGATRPDPSDGITGMICPAGGYCLQGATSPSSCPVGKYNPEEGAKTASSCINCLPGKYCAGSANPTPTGDCDPGYYCPAGSSSPTQNPVSPGYYAPAGQDIQRPCPRGTYQPSDRQASCIDCEAGAYCPNVAMTASIACPKGYYCPANTFFTGSSTYYEPIICPLGTYNDLESMSDSSACKTCPAGKYCGAEGLDAQTASCSAGYFCTSGAYYANPPFSVNTASGVYGPCPMGSYCAADTSTPTNCVAGTYSKMTKLSDNTYCKACEPGYYCATAGLSSPTNPCDVGYYCAAGSTVSNQNLCTANNFCPQGSPNEERCPIGFYNTLTGQGKCTDCGTGFVCFDGVKADCS